MTNHFFAIMLVLAFAPAALAAATAKPEPNIIFNPGFEQGFDGWQMLGPAQFALDKEVKHGGRQSARITVEPGVALQWQQVGWKFPVKPGRAYTATVWARCKDATGGAGAYVAIEFTGGGKRISVAEGTRGRSENWHQLVVEGVAPEGADGAGLSLVMHANGTAWFDDARLYTPVTPQARATLTLHPRTIITDRWQGYGCQSDLQLYRKENIAQGLNDADRKLVIDRVRAMRPQIARLLFQVDFWESERGKHTPDSEGMKDLRETLSVMKEIGADVHLNEWGFPPPAWARPTGGVPHPEEVRPFADSFVAAVKYLREDCGFTNIRYVTMTNEPNGSNYPLKEYVRLYRALDQSLKDAGLRKDVAILGPDEANTYDWLPWAIANLDDVIDYYDAHNYTSDTGVQFVRWVAPRIADMPKVNTPGLKPPRKRFMITEFGMRDSMETFSTPHNHKYDYGIFLAEAAITSASEGASAALMWCIGDTNYGNNRMKWGLWRFHDEDWEPRPGFYSWSLITRYTELGSTVHPVNSDASDAVAVAFRAPQPLMAPDIHVRGHQRASRNTGPWTIMAVNRRKTQRPFTLTGLPPKSVWTPYVYSEKTVPTPDRGMIRAGKQLRADAKGTLTGMLSRNSFVLWRQGRELMDVRPEQGAPKLPELPKRLK